MMGKEYQVIKYLIYIYSICYLHLCLSNGRNLTFRSKSQGMLFMHNRLNVSNHGARDDLNMYKNESNLSC